jgi:hypothetical protein
MGGPSNIKPRNQIWITIMAALILGLSFYTLSGGSEFLGFDNLALICVLSGAIIGQCWSWRFRSRDNKDD